MPSIDLDYGKSLSLTQILHGARGATNQAFFLTMDLNIPGDGPSCQVYIITHQETLFFYDYAGAAKVGTVVASGILQAEVDILYALVECTGTTEFPVDETVTLDNIALSVYSQSAGTNPRTPVVRQVVINSDFESGDYAPWMIDSTVMPRVTFGVVNGRATITYSQISNTATSPAWFKQIVSPATESGQWIRFRADVFVNAFPAATRCSIAIYLTDRTLFSVDNVVTSVLNVDQTVLMNGGENNLQLWASCTGTGTNTNVQFDNVLLELNVPPP